MGHEGKKMKHPGHLARTRNLVFYAIAPNEQVLLRRPKGFYHALVHRGVKTTAIAFTLCYGMWSFIGYLDREYVRRSRKAYKSTLEED